MCTIASQRQLRGELSLVYLRIMREWGLRAGMAFAPIDPNDQRQARSPVARELAPARLRSSRKP